MKKKKKLWKVPKRRNIHSPQIHPIWVTYLLQIHTKNKVFLKCQKTLAVLLFPEVISGIPDHLKGHLSPITSTQPTRMGRQDTLQIPSIRDVYLVKPWKGSGGGTWNIIPPKVWLTLHCVAFPKGPEDVVFVSMPGDHEWRMVDLIMLLLPRGEGMGFYVVDFLMPGVTCMRAGQPYK